MLKPKVQDLSAGLRFCACGNQGKYNPNTSRLLFLITNCSSCLKSDLSCRGFERAAAPTEQSRDLAKGCGGAVNSLRRRLLPLKPPAGLSPGREGHWLVPSNAQLISGSVQWCCCSVPRSAADQSQWLERAGCEMLHPSETRGNSYSPMS